MTPNALQNLEAVNFTAELGSDSKKSPSYQATLSELVIHEAILRQALAAEPHPLGAHPSNRLDYRVYTDAANPLAFVEVTSIAPAEAWVASNNREARIYNAIDASICRQAGDCPIHLIALVATARRWALFAGPSGIGSMRTLPASCIVEGGTARRALAALCCVGREARHDRKRSY